LPKDENLAAVAAALLEDAAAELVIEELVCVDELLSAIVLVDVGRAELVGLEVEELANEELLVIDMVEVEDVGVEEFELDIEEPSEVEELGLEEDTAELGETDELVVRVELELDI